MWILIGDLHLTDNARDQYRFGIFDWIKKQQAKDPVAATFLAGDITDSKDRHSATLVNQIVAGLIKLKPPVYICMGNHDYRDNKNPFFKFLSHIEGLHFITEPTVVHHGKRMAIIPHYRKQDEFDDAVAYCRQLAPASFLIHQTFEGAIAESGVRLNGLSASLIESFEPELGIYAGDVHRPQTQGLTTYIGCPYQVRFGDDFDPRCIYVSKSGVESYPWFEAPRKWALKVRDADNILNNKHLAGGDQVKLTVEVTREEAVEWKSIRQRILEACKAMDVDIYGVKLEVKTNERTNRVRSESHSKSNGDTLSSFCKAEGISSRIKRTGEEIANGD
jgi:DNA repair exonuclease SbcCD nuclease subunit